MEKDDFSIFRETQLPVTQNDISKPTKDFVVNVISIFFNTFHIDGYAIKQLTSDQNDVLIYNDPELYEEMIKLLNMYAAMSAIYEKIFYKDFQLFDIANPSAKRTMKLMKFLANFILYYKNKLLEINDRINHLEERRNRITQYIVKKQEALEQIAISKKYRETQTARNQELKQQIENLRQILKKKKMVVEEKKEEIKRLEQKKLKCLEIYTSKKSEAIKVNKMTAELKAQVVESPEELQAQLQELEKQKESKIQEREMKYESLKEKSQMLERKEQIHSFIKKETEKLTQVFKIIAEKKEFTNQLESIMKEKEKIQYIILKLEKNQEMEENQCNLTEIKELNDQIEQRLLPLRNRCTELCKEAKEMEIKLAENQERFLEISSRIDTVNRQIAATEVEIDQFLTQCDELFKKEMADEVATNDLIKQIFPNKPQE